VAEIDRLDFYDKRIRNLQEIQGEYERAAQEKDCLIYQLKTVIAAQVTSLGRQKESEEKMRGELLGLSEKWTRKKHQIHELKHLPLMTKLLIRLKLNQESDS